LDSRQLLASNPLCDYAFFHLDFQNFKYCNDIFGYEFGDRLLKQYAVFLSEDMKDGETFARICGDKFVVLRKYEYREELIARQKAVDGRIRAFAMDAKEHYSLTIYGGICCVKDVPSSIEIDWLILPRRLLKARKNGTTLSTPTVSGNRWWRRSTSKAGSAMQ